MINLLSVTPPNRTPIEVRFQPVAEANARVEIDNLLETASVIDVLGDATELLSDE